MVFQDRLFIPKSSDKRGVSEQVGIGRGIEAQVGDEELARMDTLGKRAVFTKMDEIIDRLKTERLSEDEQSERILEAQGILNRFCLERQDGVSQAMCQQFKNDLIELDYEIQ